jgi:hypothetical protein
VPSSTSSFDRADGCLTTGQLLGAAVLAAVLLLAVEALWRSAGATPGYVDSVQRWAYAREGAVKGSPFVIAGDSRMQFGIDIEAIEARYPVANVRQLAVAGQQPFAAVRDLANTPDFNGVIVTSLMPFDILEPFREDQQSYVDHYEGKWNLNNKLNFLAGSFFESIFVFRQQNYGLNSILQTLLRTGALPDAVLYIRTHFNREVDANYKLADLETQKATRVNDAKKRYDLLSPVDRDLWLARLRELDGLAGRIASRGGCVIAVRMPSEPELYAEEIRLFPKPEYWQEIAASKSIIAVHFDDIPGVADFDLPDLQHVDEEDKEAFTNLLLSAIERAAAGRCDRLRPGE